MAEILRTPKGLDGVAVADTTIAKSDGDGSLIYRGYAIADLFHESSFEETAYLVLHGKLPSRSELGEFTSTLRKHAKPPTAVYDLLRTLPKDVQQMDALRTATSALGTFEASLPPEEQKLSVIAKMPALVANCYRISKGKEPVEPDPELSQAANLLYMLNGVPPSPFDAWVVDRVMILYVEHDLNASAFTVRVVASTLADIYSACTAGLAALKGPLHGGANEAAMRMLLQIGGAENARPYVQGLLVKGEKVMGFGHRVYKVVDPRAQLCKQLLKQLLEEKRKPMDLYSLCDAAEKVVWEMKKLPANVDYYVAPVLYTLGIPIDAYTPIFAASRVVGWVSHYNEQLVDNRLFRPDAVYVGPKGLKYVPLERR